MDAGAPVDAGITDGELACTSMDGGPLRDGGDRRPDCTGNWTGCPVERPYCCARFGTIEDSRFECFDRSIFDPALLDGVTCTKLPCIDGANTGCYERIPGCVIETRCNRDGGGARQYLDPTVCPADRPICCEGFDGLCVDRLPVGWRCALPDGGVVRGQEPAD